MRSPSRKWQFARYALPGLTLAALGLPVYLYAPLWLAELGGYSIVGLVFFAAMFSYVLNDTPMGAWIDAQGSWRPRRLGIAHAELNG
ncbi:hypothetical protein [Zhongshania sp.]|uniref:hypothetical protein n=1 Tax=Zhongshania sp. TaxID=1971902 RepID=UPI0035695926